MHSDPGFAEVVPMTDQPAEVPAPIPFVKQLLKYGLSFGVAVAAGLAPFLGKAKVRGFTAFIEIYPVDVQDWLIPASGLLMGMIALVINFIGNDPPSEKRLKRRFIATAIVFTASFLMVLFLYLMFVTRAEITVVRNDGTKERTSAAVVTGARDVPAQPPRSPCTCVERQSASQCVQEISINPMNVRACFGEQRVALATLALSVLYLLLTGSFIAAVGFFMLHQTAVNRRRARGRSSVG